RGDRVGRVPGARFAPALHLARERGERARVARHGDDAHAGPGERLDDAAPEAAAAPGHDGRLVAKVVHGGPTPPCRCSRRRSRSAGSAPCSAGARAGGRSWGTPTGTPRGRAALGSASPPRAPPSYGARAARSSWERVRLRD